MLRYRHIVWDWNGTLLDDIAVVVDVMNGLLAARSLQALSPERYREVFTFPVRDYYAELGFDLEREPFAMLAAEWVAGYEARWRTAHLRTGASEAVAALAARGLSHSVLSAGERQLVVEQATHFGVVQQMSEIVGIDDHHAETKVEHGRRWLQAAGIDPRDVLLVGDTAHDHEVARALGVDVILFAGGHQSRLRLEACGVPVVDSLDEAVALAGSV